MPVIASSKKALRRDRRRTVVNRKIRQRVKLAMDELKEEKVAKKSLDQVYRVVDRAAKKGIMHKNKAARIKARAAKKLIGLEKKVEKETVKGKGASKKKKPSQTKKRVSKKKAVQ